MLAQKSGSIHRPGCRRRFAELQCLKALDIAGQRHADIAHRLCGIALQLALYLTAFVPARQPDQNDK